MCLANAFVRNSVSRYVGRTVLTVSFFIPLLIQIFYNSYYFYNRKQQQGSSWEKTNVSLFFVIFFLNHQILWRFKVVSDTVSVPARTVKNHRKSLGKVLARADRLSVVHRMPEEGGTLASEALSVVANSLHGLSNYTSASWTVKSSLLVTLMADSRQAAT